MKEYETTICVRVDLDEAGQAQEVKNVEEIITSKGGEVVIVDSWGRRRLAYEVNKQWDGVYTLIRYMGNDDILAELEKRFRVNENLVRHLTIVADTPRPSEQTEEEATAGEGAAEGAPAAGAPAEPAAATEGSNDA